MTFRGLSPVFLRFCKPEDFFQLPPVDEPLYLTNHLEQCWEEQKRVRFCPVEPIVSVCLCVSHLILPVLVPHPAEATWTLRVGTAQSLPDPCGDCVYHDGYLYGTYGGRGVLYP